MQKAMASSILFDIGGTNMRVAYSQDGNAFHSIKTARTPKDFKEGIAAIKSLALEAAAGAPIGRVSGCVPGVFYRNKKSLFSSPNLRLWENEPLLEALETAFGSAVSLNNDAALAGLGEASQGAGKGFHSVMYMTVSTGVGGALICGGRIAENAFGSEPGRQIMDFERCMDLEGLVSGTALMHRFGKSAKDIPQTDLVWNELASILAHGLRTSIAHWSPDAVVLGGSMILGTPSIPLEEIENKLRKILTMFPEVPVLKKAELADHSGLYGAMEFLRF